MPDLHFYVDSQDDGLWSIGCDSVLWFVTVDSLLAGYVYTFSVENALRMILTPDSNLSMFNINIVRVLRLLQLTYSLYSIVHG